MCLTIPNKQHHSDYIFISNMYSSKTILATTIIILGSLISNIQKKINFIFKIADTDGYEFLIVSLDNKQWQFEANSSEDRDEWVAAIEQQILNSLQVSI